jgi:hypothetical protein
MGSDRVQYVYIGGGLRRMIETATGQHVLPRIRMSKAERIRRRWEGREEQRFAKAGGKGVVNEAKAEAPKETEKGLLT